MSSLRRLLLLLVLVALLAPAVALAGATQARNPEDQARAKAMLLRKSDLVPGFVARGGSSDGSNLTGLSCPGVRSAGIQPTGKASTPNFSRPSGIFLSSHAYLFGTTADANAVWRDFGSKAGRACVVKIFRQAFVGEGKLVSFRTVSFPRVGERSLAFRIVAEVQSVRATVDWIMTKRSRALGIVLTGSVGFPIARSYVVSLTRIVAGRMKTVMRGA